jgi:DUF917 family protein
VARCFDGVGTDPQRARRPRPAAAAAWTCLAALTLATLAAAQSPPRIHTLSEQELTDMMVGASILCTRGGNTESMIQRVTAALRAGQTFTMIALEDVPDEWLGFTAFGIGGGGAWDNVPKRLEEQGFKPDPNPPTAADVLGDYLGKKFNATFEAETGGATLGALMLASKMGIPIIDACPSGRCLPEVQMSPFFLEGITRAPLAGTTRYGDVILLPKVYDDFRVEDITRGIAVASGGSISVAANALPGKTLKAHLIPGFLSKAIGLGRAAREAVAAGRDPVDAVVTAGGGYLLFRGVVTKSETKGERGFGWTEAYLRGAGRFAGSEYKIYNKNENMVAWRDGKLDAAAPDLIASIDPRTGWAMRGGTMIGSFVVGDDLAVVGFPNHPMWRTPKAIEMLGPRHFGFTDDYVPIERLHGKVPR